MNTAVHQEFPGVDGFLGTRASFMLDVVVVAMFAIIPLLALSIHLVRRRRKFRLHKGIQISLGVALLVAVAAFEIDLQFVSYPWRARAADSPLYDLDTPFHWVNYSLWLHLVFAIPTPLLWIFVIVQALRKFPNPPQPNEYSPRHIFWAWLATLAILMTAVTGWVFYWLAFVM